MSYINIEERNRKKGTFIMMYAASMLVVIIICTAFLIPSPNKEATAVNANNSNQSSAIITQSNDENELLQGLAIQIDSLELQMKVRDEKIIQLEQQLVLAQSSEASRPKEEIQVEQKSSPAVAINNAELRQLKKENDKLKAQVKALQDYVQQ